MLHVMATKSTRSRTWNKTVKDLWGTSSSGRR